MFAFVFESVGSGEWLVLLAVLLVVVGPKNLPSAARSLGRQYAKLKRMADSFRRQLMEMDREIDRTVKDAEAEAGCGELARGDELRAEVRDEDERGAVLVERAAHDPLRRVADQAVV